MDNNQFSNIPGEQNSYMPNQASQQNPYMQNQASQQSPYMQDQIPQQNPYMPNQAPQQSPYMQGQPQQNPYMPNQVSQQNPYMQNTMPQDPYLQMPQGYSQSPNMYPQAPGYQQPMNTAPNGKSVSYTPAQLKTAKLLCIISLACYVTPIILGTIMTSSTPMIDDLSRGSADFLEGIWALLSSLASGAHIAGIVLMIIARAKYPKYRFAKILMWVYIGLTIAAVVSVILMMVFLYYLCTTACPSV